MDVQHTNCCADKVAMCCHHVVSNVSSVACAMMCELGNGGAVCGNAVGMNVAWVGDECVGASRVVACLVGAVGACVAGVPREQQLLVLVQW